MLWNDGDFKNPGPELAGHEEAIVDGVVGDAVEDRVITGDLVARHKAGQVDPAEDAAGRWRDSSNAIGVPDIRVDFAVNEFELVELGDGLAMVFDGDAAKLFEAFGIEETQVSRAVAEDE